MARIAPKSEYFELDAHPDNKIVYTLILEITRKNKILSLNVWILYAEA